MAKKERAQRKNRTCLFYIIYSIGTSPWGKFKKAGISPFFGLVIDNNLATIFAMCALGSGASFKILLCDYWMSGRRGA